MNEEIEADELDGLSAIRIVLVEPRHPGNIGAAARAMKTMGLGDLVLVRPDDFPSAEADQRAVTAVDVLERARVVGSVAEAVGDCELVVATTGRTREHAHPVVDTREAGVMMVKEARAGAKVAVLFGSERDGLSNESLDACALQLKIPASRSLASLNLAAAVQLVCYELRMAASDGCVVDADDETTSPRPSQRELEFFFERLRETLESRDYFDAVNPTPTFTKIRRVLGRARPDSHELSLLHGLVKLMGRPE